MKPLRFTRSSRKHRVGRASARYVIDSDEPLVSTVGGVGDVQYSWIGLDERGRELEVIAFERPDCRLVVHVMPTHYRRSE